MKEKRKKKKKKVEQELKTYRIKKLRDHRIRILEENVEFQMKRIRNKQIDRWIKQNRIEKIANKSNL